MQIRSKASKTGDAGFTLIEILVVLVIMSAALAIAMPRFATWSDPSPERIGRDLVQLSQLVRLKALQSGNRSDLIVDTDARTVRADFGNNRVAIPAGIRMSAFIGRDERTTARQGSIEFSPDGSSTGGSVHLQKIDPKQDVTVRINWLTGAASLEVDSHAD